MADGGIAPHMLILGTTRSKWSV